MSATLALLHLKSKELRPIALNTVGLDYAQVHTTITEAAMIGCRFLFRFLAAHARRHAHEKSAIYSLLDRH